MGGHCTLYTAVAPGNWSAQLVAAAKVWHSRCLNDCTHPASALMLQQMPSTSLLHQSLALKDATSCRRSSNSCLCLPLEVACCVLLGSCSSYTGCCFCYSESLTNARSHTSFFFFFFQRVFLLPSFIIIKVTKAKVKAAPGQIYIDIQRLICIMY